MLRTPHDAWLSRFWTQINKQTLLCRNPHGRVIQFRLCDVALLDAIALAPAPVYLWAICGRDESLQSTLPPSEDVGWAWVGWLDLQRMTTTDDLMLARGLQAPPAGDLDRIMSPARVMLSSIELAMRRRWRVEGAQDAGVAWRLERPSDETGSLKAIAEWALRVVLQERPTPAGYRVHYHDDLGGLVCTGKERQPCVGSLNDYRMLPQVIIGCTSFMR